MNAARTRRTGVRWLACTLALTTTLVCAEKPAAWAMLAPAQLQAGTAASPDRARDMKAVQAALETKVVRERLKEYGLSDREVQARLARLSDAQLHQLAARSQAVAAGGDDGGEGAGFVVGLLFITLLVVLIVYLVKRV